MPIISVEADTRGAEAVLNKTAQGLQAGYPRAMKRIGVRLGRSIGLNFKNRGRPEKFAALSPVTIKRRREKAARTGKDPVAGFDTPLRDTDALRRAAIDTGGGAKGSAYKIGARSVQVGVDTDEILYARTVLEGYPAGNIPARPAIIFQDSDWDEARELVAADVVLIAKEAQR